MNTIEFGSEELKRKIIAVIDSKNKRMYASFWESPKKPVKERGIVCDFVRAVEIENGSPWIKTVKAHPNDPPDCEGITFSGELIAFEVTELVDGSVIRRNKAGGRFYREWRGPELITTLHARLLRKDRIFSKKDQGQLKHYAKIVLVIHTDEPQLRHGDCAEMLRQHTFDRCNKLTEAYLLFSYCPGQPGYPYLRLCLA